MTMLFPVICTFYLIREPGVAISILKAGYAQVSRTLENLHFVSLSAYDEIENESRIDLIRFSGQQIKIKTLFLDLMVAYVIPQFFRHLCLHDN